MGFKQNYEDVESDGSEMKSRDFIPEGVYAARVDKAFETVTKTSNRFPMVKVMLRITEEGEQKGKVIWDNIVFCESMKGRNKHLLKVLEQPYDGEFEVEAGSWLNQELKIKIKLEPYKGKSLSKISQYLYMDDEGSKETKEEKPKKKSEFSKEEDDEQIPF